jgi:hypothetical protein
MKENIKRLIALLVLRTIEGKIEWDKINAHRYRAVFSSSVVAVARDLDAKKAVTCYHMGIDGCGGLIIDRVDGYSNAQDDLHYSALANLYSTAESYCDEHCGTDNIIDELESM